MSDGNRAATGDGRILLLAAAAFLAAVAYPYAVIVTGVAQPGYDATSDAVSALVRGDYGVVVSIAAVLLGLGALALSAALKALLPASEASRGGRLLLGIFGVGTIAWGAFPLDSNGEATGFVGGIHGVAGAIAFTALAIAPLVLASAFRHDPRWRVMRGVSIGAGVLLIVAFAVMQAAPADSFGLAQRAFFFLGDAWLLALAVTVFAAASERRALAPAA